MHFQRPLLLVLAFGVASATGCQLVVSPFIAAKQKPQSNKPSIKPNKPSITVEPKSFSTKEFDDVYQLVTRVFAAEDFNWIDSEARRLRQTKERVPGGAFKLRALYTALGEPQGAQRGNDSEWEAHIARLGRWIKQEPRSLAARVGLSSTWTHYAWKARGEDSADNVSASDMNTFAERLATAAEVLKEASFLEERCPEWYYAALGVGLGQGWDRSAYDRIFLAGVELEPTYYYLYQAKAYYLTSRWYGQPGESEKFAEESTLSVGGPQGDIIFFLIYSKLLTLHETNFRETLPLAQPRLLEGFRAIDKLYGARLDRLNVICILAHNSTEYQSVAELFNRLGENYDLNLWGSKKDFESNRQHALSLAKADRTRARASNTLR